MSITFWLTSDVLRSSIFHVEILDRNFSWFCSDKGLGFVGYVTDCDIAKF